MSRYLLYGKLPHEDNDAYAKHAEKTIRVLQVVAEFAVKEGVQRYATGQVIDKLDKLILDGQIERSQTARQILSILSIGSLVQKFPELLAEIEQALK